MSTVTETFKLLTPHEMVRRKSLRPTDVSLLLPTNAKPLYMGEFLQRDASNPNKVIRGTDSVPCFAMYAEQGRTDMMGSKKIPLLYHGGYEADTLLFINTPAITHGCALMIGSVTYDSKTGLSGLKKHAGASELTIGYCLIVPGSNSDYLRFMQTLV